MDLAEAVVEAEVFPKVLTCLQYPDETVRKASATLVRETAKHSVDLAQLIVGSGGVGTLVDYIQVLQSTTCTGWQFCCLQGCELVPQDRSLSERLRLCCDWRRHVSSGADRLYCHVQRFFYEWLHRFTGDHTSVSLMRDLLVLVA